MPNKFSIFLLFLFLSIFNVYSADKVVTVGRARIFNNNRAAAEEQALKNAQRFAVEQQVGVYIDSSTLSENWRVIQDNVYQHSTGFISSYSILNTEMSPDQDYWEVTIEATVSENKIKDRLKTLRILQNKTENRHYTLIYRSESDRAFAPQRDLVVAAENVVKNTMSKYNFRFFNIQDNPDIRKLVKELISKNIDYYVFYEITPNYLSSSGQYGLKPVAVTVTMKAYQTETQEIIAVEFASLRVLTNAPQNSPEWEQALYESAINSAVAVSEKMVDSIADYYAGINFSGDFFTLIFTDFNTEEQNILMNILKKIDGYTSLKELKRLDNLLSVEYRSRLKKEQLHQLLVDESKNGNINMETVLGTGNRFVFRKAGAAN